METVVTPPGSDADLRLLTDWGGEGLRQRGKAGVVSIVLHVVGITALMMLPASYLQPPERSETARVVTPLVAPPMEPTQTDPNTGPVSKEVTAEALMPRPRIQVPPSPPSSTRPAAMRATLPSPPPPAPPPALAEPPKLSAQAAPPAAALPAGPTVAPPPRIQPEEKPKLAFESPGGAPPPGRAPGGLGVTGANPVQEAIRSAARGGAGGGVTVGDIGAPGLGGIGEGMNLPPSPGRQASNLELLSDPQGVDFRPYLIRVLSAVRRNWWAVMPESAKLGRQGRVGIQFSVARNGSVPKLVIVGNSGTEAFDRAAVASISASNPFPPLPTEFRGEQIRLQLNFAYNIPRR